ncbi:MAG: dipeptidase [Halioglobus sp.]
MKRLIIIVSGLIFCAVLAFLVLAPALLEQSMNKVLPLDAAPPGAQALDLHQKLFVGDLHTDSTLWRRDLRERSSRGHVDLPRLRQGNVGLQVFTTVTKSPAGLNYESNSTDALDSITALAVAQRWPLKTWGSLAERALYQAKKLTDIATGYPDELKIIRTKSDLDTLVQQRQSGSKVIGGIIGTEGSHALDGDLSNIDRLYDAGFRVMGLQHFFDNHLGGSLHGNSGAGLTDFGRQAVTAMLDRQIIIDVAHSSPAVVREVLAMSTAPVIVSHTGLQGHCQTPRNISDELMQTIAARGGIIGIGFWDAAICEPSAAGIVSAIQYGVELVGEDHIALGSDYDGSVTVPFDTAELARLTQEMLTSGMTERQIRKVMGGNMLRFFQAGLPAQ